MWTLATRFASRMPPQVFRPDAPAFWIAFAPEHQRALKPLIDALPADIFTASDSLGWVYQFWQARKKDEINKSEVKIGAEEFRNTHFSYFIGEYGVEKLVTIPELQRQTSIGSTWGDFHHPRLYLKTISKVYVSSFPTSMRSNSFFSRIWAALKNSINPSTNGTRSRTPFITYFPGNGAWKF